MTTTGRYLVREGTERWKGRYLQSSSIACAWGRRDAAIVYTRRAIAIIDASDYGGRVVRLVRKRPLTGPELAEKYGFEKSPFREVLAYGIHTDETRELAALLGLREGKHTVASVAKHAVTRLRALETVADAVRVFSPLWRDEIAEEYEAFNVMKEALAALDAIDGKRGETTTDGAP